MKAAKAISVPRTGPRVRGQQGSRIQARIKSNFGRLRRYLEMLLWIFVWSVRESPLLILTALITDIVARATIMAAFIGLVRGISTVATPKLRAQLLHHFTGHHIPMPMGLLVLMIAGAIATTFLISALSVSLKRRSHEKLGIKLSVKAQEKMATQFQAELGKLPLAERAPLYHKYNRFEDQIVGTLKTGAANSVELFAALALLLCTMVYLGLLDLKFLVFMLLVIALFGLFSVGFSYRAHLINTRERQARSVQMSRKLGDLVNDFIHDDTERQEAARASYSKLKLAKIREEEHEKEGLSVIAKILNFLVDPANSYIVIATPVFVFIVLYAYYESFNTEVTLVSIFTILFAARFMLQFAQVLVSEMRKFAVKYRNIRIHYLISARGRAMIPLMSESSPDTEGGQEEEDQV